MKRLIPFLLILCCSCTKYAQIFQTQPATPGITSGERLVFENDTVKISYSFWQKKGSMVFSINNKLNIPIYIDWKKSSFVKDNQKLNYWRDETFTKSRSSRTGSSFSGYDNYGLLGLSASTTNTDSRSIKPERITFLAPHSNVIKASDIELYAYTDDKLKGNLKNGSLKSPTGVTVPTKYKDFTSENTPLQFRNFLTISTTEQFNHEVYIDNGFYVSRITQLPKSKLLGKEYLHRGTTYEMPFKRPDLFWIDAN